MSRRSRVFVRVEPVGWTPREEEFAGHFTFQTLHSDRYFYQLPRGIQLLWGKGVHRVTSFVSSHVHHVALGRDFTPPISLLRSFDSDPNASLESCASVAIVQACRLIVDFEAFSWTAELNQVVLAHLLADRLRLFTCDALLRDRVEFWYNDSDESREMIERYAKEIETLREPLGPGFTFNTVRGI